MAQLINKLTILGREIRVKKATAKEIEVVCKDKGCLGYFDGNTIYVSRTLSEEQFKRVLLHEVSHAVLSITGLTNLLEDEKEEAICDAFESFVELFKNKNTNRFLSE